MTYGVNSLCGGSSEAYDSCSVVLEYTAERPRQLPVGAGKPCGVDESQGRGDCMKWVLQLNQRSHQVSQQLAKN